MSARRDTSGGALACAGATGCAIVITVMAATYGPWWFVAISAAVTVALGAATVALS